MSSPETTGLVQTWLTNAGLHHAVDNFRMAGIDSPRSLVQLELSHFEMLGVTQPEDRKKLFFLMQRVKKALTEEETMMMVPAVEEVAPTASATATVVQQDRTEFEMSVETSSMKEPISPVTLSSPLVMEEKAFDVGPDNNNNNTTTRNYMEQMLKQRANQRQQKAKAFPSSRQSLLNRYQHDVDDDIKLPSSTSDSRSYLDSGGSDTSSYDATVSSKQRRNRRKSGIPTMKSSSSSRPHHHHPRPSVSSSTISSEKEDLIIDELEECLKSPSPVRNNNNKDDAATTTSMPKKSSGGPSSSSVDVRARRTSMHSRPTIKKTNQTRPRRLSSIPVPPSMDDDNASIRSETSDLSTSLHSYSSLSSSVSSRNNNRAVPSRKNSRTSAGT